MSPGSVTVARDQDGLLPTPKTRVVALRLCESFSSAVTEAEVRLPVRRAPAVAAGNGPGWVGGVGWCLGNGYGWLDMVINLEGWLVG